MSFYIQLYIFFYFFLNYKKLFNIFNVSVNLSSTSLQHNTTIIKSFSLSYQIELKHAPAVFVIPVFKPLNPYDNNLFVLIQCYYL